LHVFILSRPGDRITRRQIDIFSNHTPRFVDIRAYVATGDVHINPAIKPRILAADDRRTFIDADVSDPAEGNLGTRCRNDRQFAKTRRRIAHFARIAQIDRVALKSFNALSDGHAANRRLHDVMDVGDIEAKTRRGFAIDIDINKSTAGHAFGIDGSRAVNAL